MISKDIKALKFEFNTSNKENNYLTHNFHSYPAKFIPKIPEISIKFFTKLNETVLDPFCGIGTTLVEANLLRRNAIGVDINPVSILSSRVKTKKLSVENIKKIKKIINDIERDILKFYSLSKTKYKNNNLLDFIYNKENISEKSNIIDYKIPTFKGLNHWFQEHVIQELAIIKAHILKISDKDLRDFLLCGFSSIIIAVSNQESDTRYAAINKTVSKKETFIKFKNKIIDMAKRIKEFNQKSPNNTVEIFKKDVRELNNFLDESSIDHIVTSPPYANVYDYYLYHKQRILWLDEDYTSVRDNEIGSRLKFSSRKENPQVYFDNLEKCIQNFSVVMKPQKFMTIVIGDSIINKQLIRVNEEIKKISKKCNLTYCKEFVFSQKEHSKSFNPSFAQKQQKNEYIIIIQNTK